LTGSSLELYLLNYHSNIDSGVANYNSTVKKDKDWIIRSQASHWDEGSETIETTEKSGRE